MAVQNIGVRWCTGMPNGVPMVGTASYQTVDAPATGESARTEFTVHNPTASSVTCDLRYGTGTPITRVLAPNGLETFGVHQYKNPTTISFRGSGALLWASQAMRID